LYRPSSSTLLKCSLIVAMIEAPPPNHDNRI
jgi:hypothetical protein